MSERGHLVFEAYTTHVWHGNPGEAPTWDEGRDGGSEAVEPELVKPPRYADLDPDPGEWDEPGELETFDFDPASSVVRPRPRRAVDYQTLRINRPTSKIMRQVWLANRRIDPALSYTEFATVVVQYGLRALKDERERG